MSIYILDRDAMLVLVGMSTLIDRVERGIHKLKLFDKNQID